MNLTAFARLSPAFVVVLLPSGMLLQSASREVEAVVLDMVRNEKVLELFTKVR